MSELPRFVLGIDPGKTTGVALYDLLTDHMNGVELAEDDVGRWLEEIIFSLRPAVVIEAFTITAHTAKQQPGPVVAGDHRRRPAPGGQVRLPVRAPAAR
jgi:hypothetical protein